MCLARRLLLYLLLTATLPACASDRFERVRVLIRQQMIEQNVPSIAVAIVADGKIVWEEGFGWADRGNRLPATEHTSYSLASISKPFTATALMVLKERGKIHLDRPINDYLGDAKLQGRAGDAAAATVRRVANHTAGLPLHYQFFYEDEAERVPPRGETIRRYGILVTAPGEKFQYSNLGYGVLDHLIARVSGKSYADFMREDVFVPLGLTHTSVGISPPLEKHAAVRYGREGEPIPMYQTDHAGASEIYSSAHDLARLAMFHLKARLPDQRAIVSDAAIGEMQEAAIDPKNGNGYGIGWGTVHTPSGHRFVGHSGGMPGVSTLLRMLPSEKIAIVVLANTSTELTARVYREVIAILLPKASPPASTYTPDPPPFKPTPALRGTWKGALHTYKREIPFTVWFLESGDVHARLQGQLRMLFNLVSFRDGYFSARMMGDVGTEDANRKPYYLDFTLKLRGRTLNGAATAMSLPNKRARNALAYWVELKKE